MTLKRPARHLRQDQVGHGGVVAGDVALGQPRAIQHLAAGTADAHAMQLERPAGRHGDARLRAFGHHLRRGAILAQPLEAGVAQHAVGGPGLEPHLGHQLRPDPARSAPGGGGQPREGRAVDAERIQRLAQLLAGAGVPARADPADIGERTVALHAEQQRAQTQASTFHGRVAADHELLPGVALDLEPVLAPPGAVGRIDPLGDDPLGPQATSVTVQVGSAADQMVAKADRVILRQRRQQALEPPLALQQRLSAQVPAVQMQQVEGEQHQRAGRTLAERRLQLREAADALLVQHDHLAVDDGSLGRQVLRPEWQIVEAMAPVVAVAGQQGRGTILQVQLDPIAVVLDLVQPLLAGRRAGCEGRQLWRHERQRWPACPLPRGFGGPRVALETAQRTVRPSCGRGRAAAWELPAWPPSPACGGMRRAWPCRPSASWRQPQPVRPCGPGGRGPRPGRAPGAQP